MVAGEPRSRAGIEEDSARWLRVGLVLLIAHQTGPL